MELDEKELLEVSRKMAKQTYEQVRKQAIEAGGPITEPDKAKASLEGFFQMGFMQGIQWVSQKAQNDPVTALEGFEDEDEVARRDKYRV